MATSSVVRISAISLIELIGISVKWYNCLCILLNDHGAVMSFAQCSAFIPHYKLGYTILYVDLEHVVNYQKHCNQLQPRAGIPASQLTK